MMQSTVAVLVWGSGGGWWRVVHSGGASANQRWWSVGWKIAKEQRDAAKDFCIFIC